MNEHFEKRIKNIRERLKFNDEERVRLSTEIVLDALKGESNNIKTEYNKLYNANLHATKLTSNNEMNDIKNKLKPKVKVVDSSMFTAPQSKPKKNVKWPKAMKKNLYDSRIIR
jgi:hypothetical protein